jgi:actin-related protein
MFSRVNLFSCNVFCVDLQMEQEEPQPIVVDNGSFTVKSGWAGEDGPRATTPPVVGTRKYKAVMVEKESGTWRQIPPRVAYGNVAMNHRPGSEIEYAIKHGVIVNWV